MSYEVKGKIEFVSETKHVTDKFQKREFVLLVEEGMYPEYIKLQLVQDRCSLLDTYKVGDIVTASFNLRGRPYTKDEQTIYFTNLDAWRIQKVETEPQDTPPPIADTPSLTNFDNVTGTPLSESDDLPF